MNNAHKGRRFERELINLLEANGFDCIRGAGSKGKVFGEKVDIVATKTTRQNVRKAYMIIIQCKMEKKR